MSVAPDTVTLTYKLRKTACSWSTKKVGLYWTDVHYTREIPLKSWPVIPTLKIKKADWYKCWTFGASSRIIVALNQNVNDLTKTTDTFGMTIVNTFLKVTLG
jgi:hypothetical protein